MTLAFTRHEAVNTLKIIGACIGIVGVVPIVGIDAINGLGQQMAGQLAALTGAILYAAAAVYGKNFSHLPATVTATGTMIWATVFVVPTSLLLEQPWTLTPSPRSALAALTLAILCAGVALLIYFRLVRSLGSMGVASQSYLRAGVGVMLGVVFLGEQLSAIVGLGVAAAIAGVALINFPFRMESEKAHLRKNE